MVDSKNQKLGMFYATLAYLGWGFFPIYWKFLNYVPVLQIVSHRLIWSFVFYTLILLYRAGKVNFLREFTRKDYISLTAASLLLMSNWMVYIYAVNSGQIVESSLGYFINPLVNILVGVMFLKEQLNLNQKIAALLAAVGVFIITYDQGHLPWIAIFLAVTFSCYGLFKKLTKISSLKSNQFESLIIAPFAVIYLLNTDYNWVQNSNIYITVLLLIGSGAVTGLPLLFFAEATQRIPYYLMGFFQFIAPTIQFLSGVLIFSEALSGVKMTGFVFIWISIATLVLNAWWAARVRYSVSN